MIDKEAGCYPAFADILVTGVAIRACEWSPTCRDDQDCLCPQPEPTEPEATGVALEGGDRVWRVGMEPEDLRYHTRSEIRGVDEVDHKD